VGSDGRDYGLAHAGEVDGEAGADHENCQWMAPALLASQAGLWSLL
jgi:hypothetical protein